MAIGDVQANILSIPASGGVLNIQPPSGNEWVIHNIYYSQGPVVFNKTDGTNVISFDSDGTSGGRLGMVFHCKSGNYIQIQNNATTSTLIGYDGVQTK